MPENKHPILRFMMRKVHTPYKFVTHFLGAITGNYYFEDYVRVYPDGMRFDPLGRRKRAIRNDINNYLNHVKFYKFAAQFVRGKKVADIGCGSGYGCAILKQNGAVLVSGADISKAAIRFAFKKYSEFADFTIQNVTDLKEYPDSSFGIIISSEVLEHIKEYRMEQRAIEELKRITKRNGLIIIGTPNNEMLEDHGFSFDEINSLLSKNFQQFCIFENALVPFRNKDKVLWERRICEGRTGIIISENINLAETVLPDDFEPKFKTGIETGDFLFANYHVDTTLLHNTHSWVILAIND